MKTLQASDGSTLAWREAGTGSPVVLLHGVGMQSAIWAPQIAALSPHYRVIALDMPGHGGSSRLTEVPSLPDYIAWLARALVALGLDQVALAGHSMGALIAGGFAATHQERLSRVALLNGVYRRSAEARAAVTGRAAELRKGKIDLHGPLSRWFSPKDDPALCEKVVGYLSAVDIGGYADAYTAFATGDDTYAELYANIRIPALILTGELDPNSSAEMTRQMAATIPGAEAVVIPGERHIVSLTAPELVNDCLLAWLDGQPQSPEYR